MSHDDSREPKSPDRPDVSTADRTAHVFRTHLESIDHLTRVLLAELHTLPPNASCGRLESVDDETHRHLVKRVRQIREEASELGLQVCGPEATMSYRPFEDCGPKADSLEESVVTYSGPDPDEFERVRRRFGDRDGLERTASSNPNADPHSEDDR